MFATIWGLSKLLLVVEIKVESATPSRPAAGMFTRVCDVHRLFYYPTGALVDENAPQLTMFHRVGKWILTLVWV
jgi:hypothetical protein